MPQRSCSVILIHLSIIPAHLSVTPAPTPSHSHPRRHTRALFRHSRDGGNLGPPNLEPASAPAVPRQRELFAVEKELGGAAVTAAPPQVYPAGVWAPGVCQTTRSAVQVRLPVAELSPVLIGIVGLKPTTCR